MVRSLFLFVSVVFLFACTNDLQKIQRVTVKNTDPNERVQDLRLVFTDSGYAKIRLYAKLAETYYEPKNVTKLKDSLCVFFYDQQGKVETILTGHYGEYYPNDNKIIIQNQVVLAKPITNERMETEELIWNQTDSSIYSNRLVTITTPNGKFYGDGIKSKQDFSSYEFIRPRGKIEQ